MTPVRVGVLLCAALLGPSRAGAQVPASPSLRRVVLVADFSARAAANELAETLGELVAPYRAVVVLRGPGDVPELDAAVTLRLARDPRGLSVSYELRRIDARPRPSALRVLTAIRGALESPAEDPLEDRDGAPQERSPRGEASVRGSPRPRQRALHEAAPRVQGRAPRRTRARVRSTWALEASLASWSPLGTGVFFGAALRLSGRVAGSPRSGAWMGVEAVVLGARTLGLNGAPSRVEQLPILFDAGWSTRHGPLSVSVGGSFAALLTRVGEQTDNATLAFGAGVSMELGVRLGPGVTLGARARGLCIGHTTVVRAEEVQSASIGPFFAAGELVLRIGL